MDKIITNGLFTIKNLRTGQVLLSEKNLVVTHGKINLTKLLAGATAGKAVTQIAVGTDGTTPTLADSGLTNQVVKTIGSGVTYPADDTVQFEVVLEATDAVGLTLREAGLLLSDNSMFARKTFTGIDKTSADSYSIIWQIKFV